MTKTYVVKLNYQFEIEADNAKDALGYAQGNLKMSDGLYACLTHSGSSTQPTPETWKTIHAEHASREGVAR